MASRARTERPKLKVRVNYEPNRLADENLANAYELALPLISQETDRVSRRLANKSGGTETQLQLQGVMHG